MMVGAVVAGTGGLHPGITGTEATGIMAGTADVTDGGGLSEDFGITIRRRSIPIRPTRWWSLSRTLRPWLSRRILPAPGLPRAIGIIAVPRRATIPM
jgi:hypothetical protein